MSVESAKILANQQYILKYLRRMESRVESFIVPSVNRTTMAVVKFERESGIIKNDLHGMKRAMVDSVGDVKSSMAHSMSNTESRVLLWGSIGVSFITSMLVAVIILASKICIRVPYVPKKETKEAETQTDGDFNL